MGHQVSHSVVRLLLAELGYSLQATSKVTEGAQHPDRGGQSSTSAPAQRSASPPAS